LSQERLAELARISGKHLGEIERGQMNATLEILGQIADALAIDAGDLFPPARGRRLSNTFLITRDEVDVIIGVAQRVKGVRAPRSKRASR
jgi:transcriptional regulator with XRE-family HTH domain